MTLTVGSLFAGIGGFDLGFEMAGGFEIVWQCEIDDWCRRVLKKHWPNVRQHDDIKTFPTEKHDWSCDIICGGFPCQDLSYAGRGAGLEGGRSNLWFEMLRVVRVVRPQFVAVENVPALLGRGMGTVVSGLAEIGYVVEWDCVSASAVGAPHRRNRIWIVAHADEPNSCNPGTMADTVEPGLEGFAGDGIRGSEPGREPAGQDRSTAQAGVPAGSDWWAVEPDVGRVANGIPRRVDRLRGLGNAVVPQVVQYIATRIRNHHETTNTSRD